MTLIPDVEGATQDFFLQFINQPGVLDQLKAIVESKKRGENVCLSKISSAPTSRKSPRPPKSPLNSPRTSIKELKAQQSLKSLSVPDERQVTPYHISTVSSNQLCLPAANTSGYESKDNPSQQSGLIEPPSRISDAPKLDQQKATDWDDGPEDSQKKNFSA